MKTALIMGMLCTMIVGMFGGWVLGKGQVQSCTKALTQAEQIMSKQVDMLESATYRNVAAFTAQAETVKTQITEYVKLKEECK